MNNHDNSVYIVNLYTVFIDYPSVMSLFSYSFPGFTLGFSNSNAKNFYNYIIFHHKNLGGQNILKA